MLKKRYSQILAVVAVLVFFTNVDVYLFDTHLLNTAPLYWITALIIAAGPLYLTKESLLCLRQSPVALWCFGFFMISCVWLLFQPSQSEVAWQELRTRLLSIGFILVLLSVFSNGEVQVWTRRAIFAAVLLGVGLNVYDLFNPQAFSFVAGRSAGFYINPNKSGIALILGMIMTLTLLPQRLRLLFAFIVGAAIIFTFSRAAIAGWAITMVAVIKTGQISLRKSLTLSLVVIATGVILAVAQWEKIQYQLEDMGVLNSNVMSRIEWLNQPAAADSSALGRQQVAAIAFEKFADSPILGQGVGASQRLLMVEGGVEISSHNQYLNLMVDHGITGFFLLPLLAAAILWQAQGEARRTCFVFALFILYIGFFNHNILEDRFVLLPCALMAAMAFNSFRQRRPLAQPADLRYSKPVLSRETFDRGVI